MTALYLQHIALRQFRSFASLNVELAPEPGVLIVHGSNGLGKSSLFDALEWTFADRIDHFRDASGANKPGTYLCRWREDAPGPTSAAVTFSDGSHIERSLLNAKSTSSTLAGDVDDITGFLRAPNWRQSISGLQRYLLLTHFLGQSTLSRLTNRSSTERFDILKEAAQSTSIQAVANALHGQGNTTVVRAYARRVETLERRIQSIDDLLEQEAALWNDAQTAGALDEAAALNEARRIAAQLANAWLDVSPVTQAPHTDSEPTVEQLQTVADAIGAVCLTIEGRVDTARRLLTALQRNRAELDEIAASQSSADARLTVLDAELERARSQSQARRQTLADVHEAQARAITSRSQLQALRDARDLVTRIGLEVETAAAALTSTTAATVDAERRVAREVRRRDITQRLSAELDRAIESGNAGRETLATIDEILALDERLRQQAATLAVLDATDPGIDQAVQSADLAWSAAVERVDAQTLVVEGLRDAVGSLSAAITSIAANLPADACDCPVCATSFDTPPELQARISSAAARLAPTLLVQEEILQRLTAARESASLELRRQKRAQTAIHGARDTLAEAREQRARLLVRLDPVAAATPQGLATARARALADLNALDARRGRKRRWLARLDADGAVSSGDGQGVRERDAAQRAEDAARRAADVAAANIESAMAALARAEGAVGTGEVVTADQLATRIDEAQTLVEKTQEEVRLASEALTAAEAITAGLNAENAALHARREELTGRQSKLEAENEKLLRDWVNLGSFGPRPTSEVIAEVEERISVTRLKVRASLDQLSRLREGRLAWSRQLTHRSALEQLRTLIDAPPNALRDAVREAGLASRDSMRAELENVRQVKETARAASADITAELDSFNAEYIKPLGFLMSQINQAILCDPRVGIDLHVKRKKIEQSAVKHGEVPKVLGEIDPVLVHSEGQMAALAVSMLTAASLTFPWSRWKALVLDDPLQHNDSIHAAAFADLMGNLVCAEGYQIFLSTHDVAQAEFLQRKFRSRRIPCTTLNLLGIGKEGVEWAVQASTSGKPQAATA